MRIDNPILVACFGTMLGMQSPPAWSTPAVTPVVEETGAVSAQALVAAADRIRNPSEPFRLTNTLTEYINGAARDRISLVVYARENPVTQQYGNLIRYVDPPRDAGKLLLLNGSKMWFYDPASKASIRISPQQRLIGQAANGDVVTVNMAHDYSATIIARETLLDADHARRDCWRLNLVASTPDAVYSRVEYWLDHTTAAVVKGKYYSDSGRLLKTAYFRRYRDELGASRPTEVIILDGIDTNLVTTMDFAGYRLQEIPESWFQRDFLQYLKVD